MKRSLTTALLLAMALAFGGAALAQPVGPPGPGPGGPGGGPGAPPVPIEQVLKDVLDFSDAQITAFRALADARKVSADALQPRIAEAQRALETVLNATTPNPAAVGAALLTVRGLQMQMQGIDETFKSGFKALLTAAQTQRLAEIQAFRDLQHAVGALGRIGL